MLHTESIPILLSTGLLLTLGIVAGKLANMVHLPRMMGYLIAGVLLGPSIVGVFSYERIHSEFTVLVDMSLAIIAFVIGGHIKIEELKEGFVEITVITIVQAVLSVGLVFAALYAAIPYLMAPELIAMSSPQAPLAVAIAIAAASASTAPAAVMSLLGEYKAEGEFTKKLLGVIAVGDVLTIVLYGFGIAIASGILSDGGDGVSYVKPFFKLGTALAIGLSVSACVCWLLPRYTEQGQIFPLILGAILLAAGLSRFFGFSPLLAAMILGFVVTNFVPKRKYSDKGGSYDAFLVIERIQEAIYGVFFLLAGAHIDLSVAEQAIGFAVMITFVRFAGKIAGCFGGAVIVRSKPEIRNYLGLAMLPAAGIMVGLTLDAADALRGDARSIMDIIVSAVLGATLLNELMTPLLVRFALRRSGDIAPAEPSDDKEFLR